VAMMDGFDTQSIAFVAPEIAAAWHVAPASFGPVFGIGLFGIISTRSACRSAAT
jgi:MFS transporter, AAHS family, 4-hydroxybenzoate transporter